MKSPQDDAIPKRAHRRPGPLTAHVAATLLLLLAPAFGVLAAPRVTIRARSEITEMSAVARGEATEIRGRVVDAITGLGLEQVQLRLLVGGHGHTVETGADGYFSLVISAPTGTRLVARVATTAEVQGSQTHLPIVRKEPLDLDLRLQTPPADGAATVERIAVVRANHPLRPEARAVISVDIDGSWAPVAEVDLADPQPVELPTRAGGGTRRVRASVSNHRRFADVIVEASYQQRVYPRCRVTAEMRPPDPTLRVRGQLRSLPGPAANATGFEEAPPVAGVEVELWIDEILVSSMTTDSLGTLHFALDGAGSAVMPPRVALRTAAAGGAEPVHCEVVTQVLARPGTERGLWALLMTTAALLAGLWLFQRVRQLLARARSSRTEQPTPIGPEIALSPPAFRPRFLRRIHWLGGRVVDARTQRPIAGVDITVRESQPSATPLTGLASRSDGSFRTETLAPATYEIAFRHPLYVGRYATTKVPHAGAGSTIDAALVAIPDHVFERYYRHIAPHLPRDTAWATMTPRQFLRRMREPRHAAWADLTAFVEEVVFSPRPLSPDVVVQLETLLARAESPPAPAQAGAQHPGSVDGAGGA